MPKLAIVFALALPLLHAAARRPVPGGATSSSTTSEVEQRMIAAAEAVKGSARPHAHALNQLANYYRAQQRYADAIRVLNEAVAVREKDEPALSFDIGVTLVDIARMQRALGDSASATATMERALTIRRVAALPGAELARDFVFMGVLHRDSQRIEESAQAFEEALKLYRISLSSDAPEMLPALDAIAGIRRDQRRYEEARSYYRQALAIREFNFGAQDAELLATLENLAYVSYGLQDWEAAEPVYTRLLNLWETAAGPDHPMVATTLTKMANFYSAQGRTDEALCAAKKAHSLRESSLGQSLLQVSLIAAQDGAATDIDGAYAVLLAIAPGRALPEHSGTPRWWPT